MRPFRPLLSRACTVGLIILGAAGCARTTAGAPESRARPLRDARSIAFAEIATARVVGTTAYDAVRLLRPEFLERRYPSVANGGGQLPAVYVNDRYAGDLEVLRSLPAASVVRIRLLTPAEAGQRFGMLHDYRGGVILVQTAMRR